MKKSLILISCIFILAGCQQPQQKQQDFDYSVQSFEECVAAGNPVMESYPRKCRHGDITFTEIIDDTAEILATPCTTAADCRIPFKYAVQSNCPYQPACIENTCAVVCPLWEHSPDPNESISYEVQCSDDSDCDCSAWDTNNKYDCACIEGQCASVVEK